MWYLFYNLNTSRYVFGGHNSGNTLIEIRVFEQLTQYHEDIDLITTSTFNSINSSTLPILTFSPTLSVGSQTSNSGSINNFPTITETPVSTSITYISDVSYNLLSTNISLNQNTVSQITIELPCYDTITTLITYTLSDYNGNSVPSWVILDSPNFMLNVSTPGVSQNTSFEFAINVTISGDSTVYQKPVTINVIYDGCTIDH